MYWQFCGDPNLDLYFKQNRFVIIIYFEFFFQFPNPTF